MTNNTCKQTCMSGYSDNNNGNGQEYTCPNGVFTGTKIVCTGNITSNYIYTVFDGQIGEENE